MKKIIILASVCMLFSSCATIFTNSSQNISFSGIPGTKLYDANNNMKLGEIGNDNVANIRIKKKMGEKHILAKKDGYKTTPLVLESKFNTTSLWNILFWPGFFVDLGTGQMNKWETTYVEIDMEKANNDSSED